MEAAHYNDPASNAQVLQFLQLDGVHGLTSLVGTVFATTRLAAGPGVEVLGGAKIKIVRTAEVFTVESGVGRVANVVIPVSIFICPPSFLSLSVSIVLLHTPSSTIPLPFPSTSPVNF